MLRKMAVPKLIQAHLGLERERAPVAQQGAAMALQTEAAAEAAALA